MTAAAPERRPEPGRKKRRWPWVLAATLTVLLLALSACVIGLWRWAGQDGALAQALGWLQRHESHLWVEGVTGNLSREGRIATLKWERDGLSVVAHDAQLKWSPRLLLRRGVVIEQLHAREILIADQRPQSEPEPPPEAIALPLAVDVQSVQAGRVVWKKGGTEVELRDLRGHYRYDQRHHALKLDNAQMGQGSYSATLSLSAEKPTLDASLVAHWRATAPDSAAGVRLEGHATLRGPLTDLDAELEVKAAPAADAALTPAQMPEAKAKARITPWADWPVPQLQARFRQLDLAVFWPQLPRTLLQGEVGVMPQTAQGSGALSGVADLRNTLAGPWDLQRLPLEQIRALVQWQDGSATVQHLTTRLAGGEISTSGRVRLHTPADSGTPQSPQSPPPQWSLQTRLTAINPALLHSQLAPLRLAGAVDVQGRGANQARFDVQLHTAQQAAGASATLGALALQRVQAQGTWDGQWLQLPSVLVKATDASLSGQLALQPAQRALRSDLALQLPGGQASLKGAVAPDQGQGRLQVGVTDARRLQRWLALLPGLGKTASQPDLSGDLRVQAQWQGGWRNPALDASLTSSQLLIGQPQRDVLKLLGLQLQASGPLDRLQWKSQGRVAQSAQGQVEWQLVASTQRLAPQAPSEQPGWQAKLDTLSVKATRQETEAPWRLSNVQPVLLRWEPGHGQPLLDAGHGRFHLVQAGHAADLQWQSLRWQADALQTQGQMRGLPLAWADGLSGGALSKAGLQGDAVIDGDWAVQWPTSGSQPPSIQAQLLRRSGDLVLQTTDGTTGQPLRFPAGLQQAALRLSTQGQQLVLAADWQSQQAGQVQARMTSSLAAARDATGSAQWSWPESAPLQGQIHVRLPRVAVWSALAPAGWRVRGTLESQLQVGGTRGAPQFNGQVHASDVAVRSVIEGIEFNNGTLNARLQGSRVLIDELRLHGAGQGQTGGQLLLTGQAGWADGQMAAQLNAKIDQLRPSLRADRDISVSGEIMARLAGRQTVVQGQLRVDQAHIQIPDESTPSLGADVVVRGLPRTGQATPESRAAASGRNVAVPKTPKTGAVKQAQPAAANPSATAPMDVQANLRIGLGENFRVQGMGIDTRLRGDLALTAQGPAGSLPRLTGMVNTVNGTVRAYGQRLDIQHGNIGFTGPVNNPALDILALRPNFVSEQRVGVRVRGTALLPRIEMYSQPTLPDNEVLAWLLLGHAAPASHAEAAMLQSAALALLGGRDGQGIAQRVGLDQLSLNTGDDMQNASVTLGRRLADNLYASYEQTLSGTMGTLFVYYEISKRWTLRAQAGAQQALDLIFNLSFDGWGKHQGKLVDKAGGTP